ncbi:MAG: 30S ribosome-binding factor RbfA [Candidatus Omnitrophota bacterium]
MSRQDRITEAIKREVSMILHDELKDPRLGFITVTHVEMTPDLRFARIFFSVLGKEEDHKKTKQALDSALGFIRSKIAQRINLRLAPEIAFKEDRSSEYSVRIQEVLQEIKQLTEAETPAEEKAKPKKKKKEGRGEHKKSRRLHKKA